MSIGIYNVNNLFTIKRISETCKRLCMGGWKDDRWMDGMFWWGREQDGVWGQRSGEDWVGSGFWMGFG